MVIDSREETNSVEEMKMPAEIIQTKSDDITDALRRLASMSSNYHPQGKGLQSTLFDRVREGQSIRVGNDDGDESDVLSSPTVSCCDSLTDDDFSLESTDDVFRSGKERPPLAITGSCSSDGISISSMNTVALKRIDDLKKKLEVQENTKLELMNKCMHLENELQQKDNNVARAKMLEAENEELREQSFVVQNNFLNEINELMKKMEENERLFREHLKEKDKKIEELEQDIQMLQIAKNIDVPSEIAVSSRSIRGIRRFGKSKHRGGSNR